MRDIRFRAWDKVMGLMIPWEKMYGIENMVNGTGVHIAQGDQCFAYPSEIELMQFTGLLDRNGKEIWEGDIIAGYPMKGHIIFSNGSFLVEYKTGNVTQWDLLSNLNYRTDVIGNAHENPEPLK